MGAGVACVETAVGTLGTEQGDEEVQWEPRHE